MDRLAWGGVQRGIPDGTPVIKSREYPEGPREETSLFGFVNVILRHRAIVGVCALAGALIVGVQVVNEPTTYLAYTSFTVSGARATTPMSTLASQLGLTLGSSGDRSLDFYMGLVTSRAILSRVLKLPYTVSTPKGPVATSLQAFLGIKGPGSAEANTRAINQLKSQVFPEAVGRSGVLNVFVRASRPEMAQQIAQNLVRELEVYNTMQRRDRTAAEAGFIEKMLDDARSALARTEEQLSRFQQVNRDGSSPALVLESNRLGREVRIRQQFYTAAEQAYEQAKIEQVRDVPTITVLDQAEAPIAPETGSAIRKTLLGLVTGLFVGIVLAFVRERTEENREEGTPAYAEYSALKEQALTDLRRPLGGLGRVFGRKAR